MTARKLTGPGAGVEKYDLITALAVIGFSGSASFQTSMMRLIAVVTARYNWTRDEVSIGQRELASLWNVDQRTAKREVKRLLDSGLLAVKRPGVRGRVASYRLIVSQVYQRSEQQWGAVGSDFSARMLGNAPAEGQNVVRVNFSKPEMNIRSPVNSLWGRVCMELRNRDAACFDAWFGKIESIGQEGDLLVLKAPTTFIARYVSDKLSEKLTGVLIEIAPSISGFRFEK